MPILFTEDTYEQAIIELFENMGYDHLYAPDLDRDYSSPLLDAVLRDSLVRINRGLPVEAIDEALLKLKTFDTGSLVIFPQIRLVPLLLAWIGLWNGRPRTEITKTQHMRSLTPSMKACFRRSVYWIY
jgi:hypothetical protein